MAQYDEPDEGGGNRMYPKDIVNHLLLVWAIGYIEHSPTQFTKPDKPSDVVVVDVVDLDMVDEETGQVGAVGRKSWWRQARLIQDLKRKVGRPHPMLVRMTRGVATVGQPPFVITSMSGDPACTRRADAWLERNPDFKPSVWEEPVEQASETPETPETPVTLDDARVNQGEQPAWSTPPATPNPEHQSQLKRMAAMGAAGLPPASPEQAGF